MTERYFYDGAELLDNVINVRRRLRKMSLRHIALRIIGCSPQALYAKRRHGSWTLRDFGKLSRALFLSDEEIVRIVRCMR